jgi:single-strand DNA-binding protein
MINKVTLIGRLGNDPEVRHLEGGTAVASVSLATNDSYKDKDGNWQDQTEWHNVVMWRDMAERAGNQLKKGMLIFVEGKITYRKYTDKEGIERRTTDIVASSFRILEKREGSSNETRFPMSEPGSGMGTGTQTTSQVEMSPGSDDLPF